MITSVPQVEPRGSKPAKVTGSTLVARALAQQGVDTLFYLMGGPINNAMVACVGEGIRTIDVRHEQAAALAAQAYARVLSRPGVCAGCSGPGAINLTTGLANALIDCAPVVALGGSSPVAQLAKGGAFQEIDQVAIMRPVTKWAERVYETKRIPDYIALAFREATSGKPGPVYLDLPGDVLYDEIDDVIAGHSPRKDRDRPAATPEVLDRIVALLRDAKRPMVLTGSGILWSQASAELQRFVELAGIPFYTTPQGRGVIPEDHPLFYGPARITAMREADVVLVIGTRLNYIVGYGTPPRFAANASLVRIDIDPEEINRSEQVDIGILGDAKTVLGQLCAAVDGKVASDQFAPWRERLAKLGEERAPSIATKLSSDQVPIHPWRLCKEIRDVMDRDAILCVDGHEILTFGRHAIPSFFPGHRLNSGPFGMMGVGMPFGIGAKAAKPDKQVIVLHGDGSFGMNGWELDTAIRHKLPILVVISMNGGWSADPDSVKPGRNLGYPRLDKLAESLGCYGEFVERPEDIRPALERAVQVVKNGQTALVNVVTDWRARAQTMRHSAYET